MPRNEDFIVDGIDVPTAGQTFSYDTVTVTYQTAGGLDGTAIITCG